MQHLRSTVNHRMFLVFRSLRRIPSRTRYSRFKPRRTSSYSKHSLVIERKRQRDRRKRRALTKSQPCLGWNSRIPIMQTTQEVTVATALFNRDCEGGTGGPKRCVPTRCYLIAYDNILCFRTLLDMLALSAANCHLQCLA